MTPRYLIYIVALLFSASVSAQTCDYQLIMEDLVRGDGWNGGQLTVRIAGVPSTYTLGTGRSKSVFLRVNSGDDIELDFRRGAFPEETSFRILNNNDSLIYQVTAPATMSNLASFTASCAACAAPPLSSIQVFRVRFNSVDIRLRRNPAADMPRYLVEYGLDDFDPETDEGGLELVTTDSLFRISGLETETTYSFYLSTICGGMPGDTSDRRGPFVITTQKEVDLGVTLLRSPETGCDMDVSPLTIGITNYGGAPQQFIRIGYEVDGEPIAIDYPRDGIFTGIVNVDSTEFFTFDGPVVLDGPGRHRFKIYTLAEGDEDRSNDTLVLSIVNQPTITEYPYTENFEMNDGYWVPARGDRGPISWAWGEPTGEVIDRAPEGRNAWVTGLFGDYFNDEESYLISPCFDFSGFDEDPYFSCALIVDTEVDFDDLRLEMTTDNGESWTTVGISPADLNWYNDRPNQVWEGDGGFGNGPRLVGNLLGGAAGEVVKLRFVFKSSLDDTREGVLIDAVTIGERPQTDIGVVTASGGSDDECPLVADIDATLTYQNLGQSVIDTVVISYLSDVGMVNDTIIERLSPGNFRSYSFTGRAGTPTVEGGVVSVTVTTPRDVNSDNDVFDLILMLSEELPFSEDFEDGLLPESWRILQNAELGFSNPLNSTAILGSVDQAGTSTYSFRTAYYQGDFLPTDTLKFTVDIGPFAQADRFALSITLTDCDMTRELFETDILATSAYAIPLTEEMLSGYFTFEVTALTGSGTVAIDDISVRRCPDNLGVVVEVLPTSTRNSSDARATLRPSAGSAPYTYQWSTGATSQSVDGLAFGDYVVTVTDRLGCSDELAVVVRNFVDTEDPEGRLRTLRAFPNPTGGLLNLTLDLSSLEDIITEVYDGTGRRLERQDFGRITQLNTVVDLSRYAPGVYLVRVQAGGAARSVRVLVR